jgi:2-methylisocitrate lyase-like PEP mutase family enzyme
MNKFEKNRIALKDRIATGRTLIVPGAHDPVSAKLVEEAGFDAVYVGSYATAAARLGLPDVGSVTMNDMVAHAGAVVDAVEMPVLADAENGWNNAANVWRTIRSFEQAGVSGIHIEDHEFGKHTSLPPVIAPLDVTVAKLKAALAARTDPNFLIVARTDTIYLLNDVEEGIRRMNAFTDAGADLVMPSGMDTKLLLENRDRIKGKVMITDKPGRSVADEEQAGAAVVLYYGFTLYAAYTSVKAALTQFKKTGSADEIPSVRGSIEEFEEFIGYPDFTRRANAFGLG